MIKIQNLLLFTFFLHVTDAQSSQPTHELTQPLLIVTTQQSPEERLLTLKKEFTAAYNNSYEMRKHNYETWMIFSCVIIPYIFCMVDLEAIRRESSIAGSIAMTVVTGVANLVGICPLGLALFSKYKMYQEQKHNHPATTQLETIKQELTQNFTPLQIATFLSKNKFNETEPFYREVTSTFNIKRVTVHENNIKTEDYYRFPNRIEKTTKSEKEL